MRDETQHTRREAKHLSDELHHLHGNHNEKALHHIQKELHDEQARDPHHFKQLLKDMQKDLKKDHDHRHLGVEFDHKGHVSHVAFNHHDIYKQADHKKHEHHKGDVAKKPVKDDTPQPIKGGGDAYLDSSNSRPSKPDVPIKPDVRPETIAKILGIRGSGAPVGIPYEMPGRDGNG